ncbi:MAG: helix-turn-helix domain-containing protein [Actinomycetota bacterium]|nr:helix-turn-helix domain-containing protein [Actinomycetota bacterium]
MATQELELGAPPPLLKISDVQRVTRLSRASIYRRIKDGEFETVKLGGTPYSPVRITSASLWAYLNKGTRRAA